MADDLNEDGALDTPLHLLPGFGTGLHRRPIAFVAATTTTTTSTTSSTTEDASKESGTAVANAYLGLVLGGERARKEASDADTETADTDTDTAATDTCPLCNTPLSAHSSLVHHLARGRPDPPPAAVDRRRFGFAVLAAHGWDPDCADTARRGLGPAQTGRARALAPRPRPAGVGIGADGPAAAAAAADAAAPKTTTTTNTKSHRRRQERARQRRAARLHEQLLGSRDLDRYLGPQAEWE